MNPEQEIARAGEAEQILHSKMFQEAKAFIESSLANQRLSVPIKDTEMHTRLIIAEQVWGKFLGFFAEVAESGKLARIQLTNDRNMKERVRSLFGNLRG
jgi:hypothetical protein